MKLGIFFGVLLLATMPTTAGTLFTVFANQSTPVSIPEPVGHTLTITVGGFVDILGSDGTWRTNPDGSLFAALSTASCPSPCWTQLYGQYVNPGAVSSLYPSGNPWPGGGSNYDLYFDSHSPYAAEGAQTLDPTVLGAIRLGALAYVSPAAGIVPGNADWRTVTCNAGTCSGVITVGASGMLELVVVDTYYPNNSGGNSVGSSFSASITDTTIPEPSAAWLAFSGAALLGLTRIARRRCGDN